MNKGSWWPRGIIGFFIALAAFESWFVYVAMTKHRSTVIEAKPYEAGLLFGGVIEAKQAARRDGVSLSFALEAEKIHCTVAGIDFQEPWRVTVRLLRLEDPTRDQEVTAEIRSASFVLPVAPLKEGQYLVRTTLERGAQRYFFERYEHAP